MIILLLLHAVAGGVVMSMSDRLQRFAWAIGAIPMVATLGYVSVHASSVLDGDEVTESYTWIEGLDLAIMLRLDGFGLLMTYIVSGIGVAIMLYGSQYFSTSQAASRTAGLLVLFSGSMLGLVLANHLLFLFLCWELTSITSWQLIGAKNTDPAARSGALHALLVTSAGGLALLAGLILLGQVATDAGMAGEDRYVISEIVRHLGPLSDNPPSGTMVGFGLALCLVGIMTKSAQFPTHAWLPGAMVAPTPVSAYLHSATMVKAGIYLAARLAPVFAIVGDWRAAVSIIGLTTMLLGGLRALRQHDLKLLLAMGTISQLGFMLVLLGTGRPEATTAGVVLLFGHAMFKAALFLVVGIVDHQAGTRDIRELAGFGDGWGPIKAVAVISAASMAGLPPLLGFVAKEEAFGAFVDEGFWGNVTLAGLVVGSVLTFAYSYRFAAVLLARPGPQATSPPPPTAVFAMPAVVIALITVLGGVAPWLFDSLIGSAATALDGRVEHVHLALWHGWETPLYLSAAVIAGGVLLVAASRPFGRLQEALRPRFGGEEAFQESVEGLFTISRKVTGFVQNGSLPIYCAVILTTAVVVPGSMMVVNGTWPEWPDFAETPGQVVIAGAMVAAMIAAVVAKRRFTAVLLLGAIGYGMGLLFMLQGAPDLALTQFSIETLSIVVFMLVLRKLPYGFKPQLGRRVLVLRALVASLVAVAAFTFILVSTAPGPDGEPPGLAATDEAARALDEAAAHEIVERSEPEAHGKNVVNVVLVDFRGFDTLGEISVLAVAALGILGLAWTRTSKPDRPGSEDDPLETDDAGDATDAGAAERVDA
jgi:multicomponent Na+:H+ antiporter subunit A